MTKRHKNRTDENVTNYKVNLLEKKHNSVKIDLIDCAGTQEEQRYSIAVFY